LDQQQSNQSKNQSGTSFGRFLGIVLTFGLIVSFPVFSYLTPEIRYLLIPTKPSVQEVDPGGVSDVSAGAGFYRRGAADRAESSGDRRSLSGPSAAALDSARSSSGIPSAPSRQRAPSGAQAAAAGPAGGLARESGGAGAGAALPSGAAQAFERMDRELSQAADFVFPGAGGTIHSDANPFRRALNSGSPGGSAPEGSDPDSGSTSDPPPPASTPPPGEEGPSGGSSEPPGQSPNEEEFELKWSFLVAGPNQANGQFQTLRAYREPDGRIAMEDGTAISILPGVVGTPQRVQFFSKGEVAVSVDFNGNGARDLVVARRNALGSTIELHLAQPGSQRFAKAAESFLFLRLVEGLAVYDINGDGRLNVVAKISSNPNLLVYEQAGNELRYLRELGMSVEPFLLVSTRETRRIGARKFLHVQNRALERTVFFNSQFPGIYFNGRPATFRAARVIELESESGVGGPQIVVLEYADAFALLLRESGSNSFTFLGAFDAADRIPNVIWGDFLRTGTPQLIYMP
jgi:hypothetical protein